MLSCSPCPIPAYELAAAIRLRQLCRAADADLSVCVLEKGAEVGARVLSGNVFEPRALDELIPEWRQEDAPIRVHVSSDKFWMLTKNKASTLPSPFDNKGNYVISLSQLVRWMSVKAEELGVEVYPGFATSESQALQPMMLVLLKMVVNGKLFNRVWN
ncbi:electron transfer flavoprotein-ubiquinone oxidoreductase, mitochondrial-like [Hordeum vulgare subsp. vulgare]|uniref:electron transfer flavoprotein-ubiquinone oxidoreductase, mitochondrial-like n=1 Tax=Hordeum vulgare subsp. vulgare TaxID=112509 RepID=UPI001D1A5AAB|nr:electron transfer flavoprotein-ubiquinone oxidoreductase, mitochondrial-like [Hordeum vulgare subsp. vulgare]